MPVQGIVVAAVTKVEKDAGGSEKSDGLVERGVDLVGGGAAKLGQPGADVRVAQAAGGVLHVGFEVEQGVAVAGVAIAGEVGGGGGEGAGLAGGAAIEDFGGEGRAGFMVAGEEAQIEKGESELWIGGFEAFAVGEGAGDGRDLQAAVPERLGEASDEIAGEVGWSTATGAEEEVDIGVGEHLPSPVAAGCQQGQGQLGRSGLSGPDRADQLIEGVGAGLTSGAAVAAGEESSL